MMLWANAGRSYLEEEYVATPSEGQDKADALCGWVLSALDDEATVGEKALHQKLLGTWTEREIIDNSWDTQAAPPLYWAFGLLPQVPAWDAALHWDKRTDDFYEFPNPELWRPQLTLRRPDEVEEVAKAHETCYWRIRSQDSWPESQAYVKKLLRRASRLGHVVLGSDGDLKVSDGRSLSELNESEFQIVGSVVVERLSALNWLCGQEESWDDITADTIVSWLWDENWIG